MRVRNFLAVYFKKIKLILLVCMLATFSNTGTAQYCTPDANCSDGDEIDNFIFNTISNLSSGGSNCNTNSYINTGLSTTVMVGLKYAIAMQAGTAWSEGFGVWIDYNQDDDFNDLDEFIYASPSSGNNWFNDSIIISSVALPGSTRLRVRCRYNQTIAAAESCAAFNWGETEDYTVNIVANNSPPVANFDADSTFTCSGTINFIDQSLNGPTTWDWDFGDGFGDTIQNPAHTYTSDGTYSVSLTVTNTNGADSITFTNYITVAGPSAPSCTPATTSYCCQLGIYNVTFESINNTTPNGVEGYQDYTCVTATNITVGQAYPIAVTTGPNFEENVKVWIDYNNDGVLSVSELAFESLNNQTNHAGTVTVPGAPVTGTTLRMRVASDWQGNSGPDPCTDVEFGQFEDYSVTILPDTVPPLANFTADATITCNGIVNFTDLSANYPSSWYWDFGDGNNDTIQNPTNTYLADGIYTVTLIATNQYGSDTLIISNYINVNVSGGGPIPPGCTPASLNYCCGFGITNVTFNSINSTTPDGVAGYEDMACSQGTIVTEGETHAISVDVSGASPGAQNVRVWIDYNNDGNFNNLTELVFSEDNTLNAAGNITIASAVVLNSPLRMRVSSDYNFEPAPLPCVDLERGQAEDYSITILPNTLAPIAYFSVDDTVTCSGTVQFTDESINVPTFWYWDFGDGNSSNLQNPSNTYATDGIYTVLLYVANANGGDTLIDSNLITVNLNGGPVAASCTPSTLGYCCGYGIYNVTFVGINNSTGSGVEDYMDFSCFQQTYLTEGQSYAISISTGSSNPQDTRVWIDYNNDGVFNDATERVLTSDDKFNPTGFINIPLTAVNDTALRMRVSSDYSGSTPTPCQDLWYGQAEDYAVYIGIPPTVNFSSSDSMFCEGSCISFNDLSTDSATGWSWSFPGGTPSNSTEQFPSNICYNNPGTYSVSLTASNNYGSNSVTANALLTVLSCPVPVADFTASSTSFCQGDCISYTDISTNSPDTWAWSFPGATPDTSSLQNPSNICYPDSGSYTVTLMAGNPNGIDTITKTSFINVNQCLPIAAFSVNDSTICETGCVLFTDLSTNNPTFWSWSFSGANTPTSPAQNPTGICYNTPGTYDVTLVTTNASGSDSVTLSSFVNVLVCPPPVSNFAPSDSEICEGDCINFSDMSVDATTWTWTFDGGTPSSSIDQHPTNICYNSVPGTYNVKLVTSNAAGNDSITQTVKIDDMMAVMTIADTLFRGIPTVFSEASTPSAVTWTWYFGDGNFANLPAPIYTYSFNGVYTITLVVTNSNGCKDSISKAIIVVEYFAIDDANSELEFNLFPNPTSGIFTLNLGAGLSGVYELCVKNVLGQSVHSRSVRMLGTHVERIDISHLPPAIYTLTLRGAQGQITRKIIKH